MDMQNTEPPAADSSGVGVLDRAFALLGAFGPSDERLSLTELSKRTGLYKSTVLRLLGALEHGGFIRKLSDGLYGIGPAPVRLAANYQQSFRLDSVIEPLLKTLSQALNETASFYIRVGTRRMVLSRVEPARTLRVSIRVGEQFDIGRGASGNVLRAFTEDDPAKALTRARFWAVSFGERDPETAAISVPVFGAVGELLGALTVSAPLSRLGDPQTLHTAVCAVFDAARDATAEFGGSTSPYGARRPGLVFPLPVATPPAA